MRSTSLTLSGNRRTGVRALAHQEGEAAKRMEHPGMSQGTMTFGLRVFTCVSSLPRMGMTGHHFTKRGRA